jgi:hypothetical protein
MPCNAVCAASPPNRPKAAIALDRAAASPSVAVARRANAVDFPLFQINRQGGLPLLGAG